jgi:dolichol-phosphate mannosyltransferase
LEEGWDFVIGSRYIQGGAIPEHWNIFRKIISKFGNWITRHIIGITQVQDCTAGFRAIRVSILKKINLHALRVKGYSFLVALLYEALTTAKASVVEIPVTFIDRERGVSKLGFYDLLEFAINAWRIRFGKLGKGKKL